ncbi:serine/threonine-protein kinase [Actinomycetospora sp. C-140]
MTVTAGRHALADVTSDTDAGRMFGPYRLEECLGRGGTGEVFRAHDTGRGRTVALKRLHAGPARSAGDADRFYRAARTAARLSSPHVIPIHDFGTIDGRRYLAMRLVPGTDLATEIDQGGPLRPARVVSIVRQIADALDAAHADGLAHGDLTPSTVLLAPQAGRDVVYLTDIGIACAVHDVDQGDQGDQGDDRAPRTPAATTRAGATGRGVDPTGDLRALGCLLVEALSGRPAFPGATTAPRGAVPPRVTERVPGLPPAIDAVVARALADAPADRYASAGELAEAAHRALTGASTASAPAGPPVVTPPRGARYVVVLDAPPGGSSTGTRQPLVAAPAAAPTRRPVPPRPIPTTVPPRPARRRAPSPASWWVGGGLVAAILAVLGLLTVTGVVAGDDPHPAPTPPVTAPITTPVTDPGGLAAAFPDVARLGGACAPYAPGPQEYATSTGARPVAVIRCDHGAVVPGAYVYYTQWPTTADARRWQADQASGGPSLDGLASWDDGTGAVQGPRHTRAATDGSVYTTAAYADRPYSFDAIARSLDDAHRLLPSMHLLPAARVPA